MLYGILLVSTMLSAMLLLLLFSFCYICSRSLVCQYFVGIYFALVFISSSIVLLANITFEACSKTYPKTGQIQDRENFAISGNLVPRAVLSTTLAQGMKCLILIGRSKRTIPGRKYSKAAK